MGTWINGAGVNRETKKDQPHPTPSKKSTLSVQETLRRAIQHEQEEKQVRGAAGFLDKFFRLFADYSFSSARSHVRRFGAPSARTPEQIGDELSAFFRRRPRPWRYYGNRQRRA